MMRTHITAEQLMLWLDNADGAYFAVGDHIRDCEMCARRVGDERLFRCLLKWRPGRIAGKGHIDDETLAACAEERLAPSAMQSVSGHIVECDKCLMELIDLRFMMHAADEDPPDEKVLGAAHEEMARLPRRWLGRLRIRIAEPRARVEWHPSVFTRPAITSPGFKPSTDKSRQPDFRDREESHTHDLLAAQAMPGPMEPRSVEFETDRQRITIRVLTDGDLARLDVSLATHNGRLLMGFPLSLTLPGGETIESRTDSSGGVSLLVDQGESDLRFGHRPELHLTVAVEPAH